jgi:molybdopterin molybdotransferase
MLLDAAQIAAAATIGAAEVNVFARPRAAVLATGDELVPIEQSPSGSTIRNSNSPMLAALLRKFGCDVTDLGVAPDNPDLIKAKILDGLAHDVLLITGGMSMGAYDYVPKLLVEIGVRLHITKLRIKPGKPFVFGTLHSSSPSSPRRSVASSLSSGVFGLPGNPVSSFACTIRLVSRAITRLGGGIPTEKWLTARLAAPLPPNGPREFYQPVRLERSPNAARVHPLAWKGSADLFTLARADALLVRPESDPARNVDDTVTLLEI